MTGAVSEWITRVMETLGGPGAALLIALENIFPPLPSEVILLSAGFAASQGSLNLIGVIIWATVGSVVGAVVLYYVGALLGRERTRAIARRMPLVKVEDVDRTEAWFRKHETKAVFFGRMVPLFRSFISIPAGIERMDMKLFLLYTAAGSLIWNTLFVLAGYFLGDNWHVAEEYASVFQKIVVVAVIGAVAYWVIKRLRGRKDPTASGRA